MKKTWLILLGILFVFSATQCNSVYLNPDSNPYNYDRAYTESKGNSIFPYHVKYEKRCLKTWPYAREWRAHIKEKILPWYYKNKTDVWYIWEYWKHPTPNVYEKDIHYGIWDEIDATMAVVIYYKD